jgi:hypothetical protein
MILWKILMKIWQIDFLNIWGRPPNIKIWLWLIFRSAIFDTSTKDNMQRRGWQGDFKCRFCDELEGTHHLCFTCPAANMSLLWIQTEPFTWDCLFEVLCGTSKGADKADILAGADTLQAGVVSLCTPQRTRVVRSMDWSKRERILVVIAPRIFLLV